MKQKKEKAHYRHGDVMLQRVDDAALLKKISTSDSKAKSELTIALGEATGHHHTLYPVDGGSVRLVEVEGRRFIYVSAEYFLHHQEHAEHRIAPGTYEILIEDEYDPFEKAMRKVVD